MSIVIDDPDLERDLRALAAARGESVEDVLRELTHKTTAGNATPRQAETRRGREARRAEVQRIIDRFAALDVQDRRTPDEIIGYDEHGLPT